MANAPGNGSRTQTVCGHRFVCPPPAPLNLVSSVYMSYGVAGGTFIVSVCSGLWVWTIVVWCVSSTCRSIVLNRLTSRGPGDRFGGVGPIVLQQEIQHAV